MSYRKPVENPTHMQREPTKSEEELRTELEAIPIGTKIVAHYYHDDGTELRVARGTLLRDERSFILRRTASTFLRIPSNRSSIVRVMAAELQSRTASQRRDDHEDQPRMNTAEDLGTEVVATPATITTPQHQWSQTVPTPPPTTGANPNAWITELLRQQSEMYNRQTTLMLENFASQVKILRTEVDAARQANTQATAATQPGADIASMHVLGDAIRGQDSPTWRIAPGLILPRFLPDRFKIFSMPHLLYYEESGIMVRLPKGAAVTTYTSLLSRVKFQFPNQVVTTHATSKPNGKQPIDHGATATPAMAEGVRNQLERCERMFADLLAQLDQLDQPQMPSNKEAWLIYLDAGVAVLECYATLAKGFVKGGASVIKSYSNSIFTMGKFDPSKLWEEFRKSE